MKGQYSQEEINLLKEHTQQILNFLNPLRKEIRSYYTIYFGNRNYGDYEYRLYFNPNGIHGGMGRCSISLTADKGYHDYSIDDNYSAPDFMAKLCRDWKSIKSQVMQYVEQERSLTNSITEFEL